MSIDEYLFHGRHAEGSGSSLEEAIENLAEFWDGHPSLVMHSWGALTLDITIAGSTSTIQLVDPGLLDGLEGGNYQPLIQRLAADMQISEQEAQILLNESSEVVATVDRIRPVKGLGWTVSPAADTAAVLPQAVSTWTQGLSREIAATSRPGRPRARRSKKLLRTVVDLGIKEGLSDKELSARTGVPRSTIYDMRNQYRRRESAVVGFKDRRPGQRFTQEQQLLILDKLAETDNNAAQAARELGISSRSVRDIRKRTVQVAVKRKAKGHWPVDIKTKLQGLVDEGLSATGAARQLGVPGRTARGWIKTSSSSERVERTVKEKKAVVSHKKGGRWPGEVKVKLRDLVDSGLTATAAARQLGVPDRTARGWVTKSQK